MAPAGAAEEGGNMDPTVISSIASAAVALISTALSKTGEAFAGKATNEIAPALGRALGDKVAAVFGRVVKETEDKPDAASAVRRVTDAPDNKRAQELLRLHLEELMEANGSFGDDLNRLLADAAPEAQRAGVNIIVSGEGVVAYAGSAAAGKGGLAVAGDVHGNVQQGQPPKAS